MGSTHKIGMRNIKTTLAVFLCLIIGFVFKRDAFYSSIAAIMCLQRTLDQTFEMGVNRIIGTIVGGVAGFLVLEIPFFLPNYFNWSYLIIVPILIMLLIYLCNFMHISGAISMCCVVFLGIATDFSREIPDTLLYVINRVIDTTIGIALAMIVNKYISPAKKEDDGEPNAPVIIESPEEDNPDK